LDEIKNVKTQIFTTSFTMQDDGIDVDSDMLSAEEEIEELASAPCEAEPAPPVRGRSVVILPTRQATQAAVAPPALKPEIKPKRIQHTAPMVAQFRPVSAAVPVAIKAKADTGVFRTNAELVRKFHRETPERFHSKPANHSKHF
jgi:hypothetical protein